MKRNRPLIILSALLLGCLALIGLEGCAAFGTNPSPPSKVEQALFTTVTNTVTIVKTNEVAVPVFTTNTVTVVQTNQQNQVVEKIQNIINETWHTNQVVVTNSVEQYANTPKASVKADVQMAGAAINTFAPGIGTLVSTGIAALLAVWGGMRSSKATTMTGTSTAMVQQMETVLEFVKALPNGATYAGALTDFLKQHQAETGTLTTITQLLEDEVSNPDAKVAANEVITAINSLKSVTTPIAPIAVTS